MSLFYQVLSRSSTFPQQFHIFQASFTFPIYLSICLFLSLYFLHPCSNPLILPLSSSSSSHTPSLHPLSVSTLNVLIFFLSSCLLHILHPSFISILACLSLLIPFLSSPSHTPSLHPSFVSILTCSNSLIHLLSLPSQTPSLHPCLLLFSYSLPILSLTSSNTLTLQWRSNSLTHSFQHPACTF